MATHCSTLAWRIPGTEEPGGLQSTGSQRVGHDESNCACTHSDRLNSRLDVAKERHSELKTDQ